MEQLNTEATMSKIHYMLIEEQIVEVVIELFYIIQFC